MLTRGRHWTGYAASGIYPLSSACVVPVKVPSFFLPPPATNRRWPPHRKNPENPLTKMAEELGDEDLVDYEEDEVVDDKPADEVKK